MREERGTIKEGEYHPAADSAMQYVREQMLNFKEWGMFKESVASTALSGNRLSEILMSTIDRLEKGEPVSDRYLLGLAWVLKQKNHQP